MVSVAKVETSQNSEFMFDSSVSLIPLIPDAANPSSIVPFNPILFEKATCKSLLIVMAGL